MNGSKKFVHEDFPDGLWEDFFDESEQLLDRLNENLLQLGQWAGLAVEAQSIPSKGKLRDRCRETELLDEIDEQELLEDAYRAAHGLRSHWAMLGMRDVHHLTHHLEHVFDAARSGQLQITAPAIELLLQAYAVLSQQIEALRKSEQPPVEMASVISELQRLLANASSSRRKYLRQSVDSTQTNCEQEGQNGSDAGPITPVERREDPRDQFADVVDDGEIPAKYLSIFVDEADLSLDSLSEMLLTLESAGGTELTEGLMIVAHRIKGSAATVGLHRVAKLAHYMEDVLQTLGVDGQTPTGAICDALLNCTDALRTYIQAIRNGQTKPDHFAELAHELLAAHRGSREISEATGDLPATAAQQASASVQSISAAYELAAKLAPPGRRGCVGVVHFSSDCQLAPLKADLLLEKLMRLGDVFYCYPEAAQLADLEQLEAFCFGLATVHPLEAVQQTLKVDGVERFESMPLEFDASSPATRDHVEDASRSRNRTSETSAVSDPLRHVSPNTKAPRDSRGTKATETLRVDIERLDQLMNLAGQLVINKSRFAQIGDRLKRFDSSIHVANVIKNATGSLQKIAEMAETQPLRDGKLRSNLSSIARQARRVEQELDDVLDQAKQAAQVRSVANELSDALHQLDRVTSEIQQSVMDTRMVPIGPLFGRFRRVVRDITRSEGKQIRLEILGEKTELDKRMIDELGDPLIHMVRNAADHGIESPQDREAAGKPREGVVTLNAHHRGNSIVIEISDDGKGIDPEQIRNKAVEKGMISPADADRYTTQQILKLIWEPGFTTVKEVTEISGRGMGMDIVRSKIEEMNGSVELQSSLGEGTTFIIRLPLTLAILPSLLVEIDGDVFAMPVEAVVEIVNVDAENIYTVHGVRTAQVRDRMVSVVRLAEIFTWMNNASGSQPPEHEEQSSTILVVIGGENHEIALVVDHLLGENDVVIKSMADNYRNVPGIAGASILGDGRVSLILDMIALVEMSTKEQTSLTLETC